MGLIISLAHLPEISQAFPSADANHSFLLFTGMEKHIAIKQLLNLSNRLVFVSGDRICFTVVNILPALI